MIKGYSAEQLRAAEAPHLAAGVPLMKRAATGLAREISGLLPAEGGRVLLLVGGGNNGADALFAGAQLAEAGVDVAILRSSDRVHDEALTAAITAGAHVEFSVNAAAVAATVDVIVDGILGIGRKSNDDSNRAVPAALRGNARELVERVLPALDAPKHPLVVAVDIPSGIDPDDGTVPDPLVLPADVTVTFGGYKAGLLIEPARSLAGAVKLIDIGLGPDLDQVEPLVRVEG